MFLMLARENAWDSIITALQGAFSSATVAQVITSALAVSLGLAFFWFAARKVTQIIMGAFRGGHVSVG